MDKTYKLLITPTYLEADPFIRSFQAKGPINMGNCHLYINDKQNCIIAVTGVGSQKVKDSISEIIRNYSIQEMILTGIAGGLDPEIGVGQIVEVIELTKANPEEGNWKETGYKKLNANNSNNDNNMLKTKPKAKLKYGKMITVGKFITGKMVKNEIFKKTGGIICDMEGYHILELLDDNHLKIRILKVVSDDAREDIDTDIAVIFDSRGGVTLSGFLRYLFKGFSKPIAACKIIRQYKIINNSLKEIAAILQSAF
jgi:nucleoside phosphorylase